MARRNTVVLITGASTRSYGKQSGRFSTCLNFWSCGAAPRAADRRTSTAHSRSLAEQTVQLILQLVLDQVLGLLFER